MAWVVSWFDVPSWLRCYGLGFMVQGSGFTVHGLGFAI